MSKTRASIRSSGRALAMVMTASLVVASLTVTVAPAATPTFTAVGSARQVYVTGLAPSAQMSLVNGRGTRSSRRRSANSLGGLLFRDVPPAAGYRVRRVSDGRAVGGAHRALRQRGAVESGRSTTSRFPTTATRTSPPATARSSRSTCTRRRARRASPACRRARRFPSGPDYAPAVPDADRVLGLRLRQPGRTDERHRGAREPDGLRGRRREHARHRLLGWRVRLLRAAAEPRRLRRDRDDRPPTVGARTTRSG